jgi:hypothetical protein
MFAAAALGIGITLWLFHPGWLSVDSAVQYQQALTGRYDDAHPPLLAWLWHHIDRFWPGPGSLFVLITAVWWIALAAFAFRLQSGWRGALAALLIGLSPPVLLIAAHLWKDVALSASLLAASATILAFRRDGRTWLAVVALAWLAAAVCFRHNAWPAVLPLVLWLVWPRRPATSWGASRLVVALGLMAGLAVVPGAVSRAVGAAPRDAFSAVVLWDLGAVSIATGQMLIPPEVRAPDLVPADLVAGYVTWANPEMFAVAPIRLGVHGPYSAADRRAVLGAWLAMIRAHPREYLAHRARVSRHLLFGPPAEAPRELVYVPARILPPEANIVLPEVDRPRDRVVIAMAERLRTTPLFAGATWLALALAAAALALPRRHSETGRASLALAFSALAYALPLALVTGSAEFRYLHWSVIAALLAMLAAFTARQRASSDNSAYEHS